MKREDAEAAFANIALCEARRDYDAMREHVRQHGQGILDGSGKARLYEFAGLFMRAFAASDSEQLKARATVVSKHPANLEWDPARPSRLIRTELW